MKETTIILSTAQRHLLLLYKSFFAEPELSRLVSVAAKQDGHYYIFLTEEQLERLMDKISELCNHEKDLHSRDKLKELSEYLIVCYNDFDEN